MSPAPPTDDPHYGQLVTTDGKLCYHECGRLFVVLTQHLSGTHALRADDYRARWGLPVGLPLTTKDMRRPRRTRNLTGTKPVTARRARPAYRRQRGEDHASRATEPTGSANLELTPSFGPEMNRLWLIWRDRRCSPTDRR
jgi:hypothetical protein